ncbi:Manganese transport system membrane protein MntB [Planctomycetes bacterium Pan216]|uniref:Manganese transport system membrane protein MntB n=1 Tax=Kolteria novifilia TaxID=2527975 RepID=A0A518BCH0_9BACT|nr:Manganese transport system membrane protein MntB [Planctomycetes bacterium Pan216]
MITYNTLIVLLGTSLLGANCGLVGSFALLRRRALIGDTLAHATLPGLCLAFLLLGYRSLPAMLVGAFVTGVMGIVTVALLRHWTRIKEDACLGIVLSVFFGWGIVLIKLIQNETTSGSKAGLDSYIFGKTAGMIAQDVMIIGGVSLFCLLVVMLLFKEFKLVAFDASFARAQGWPAVLLDLALMGLVALTVVIGLPAVGVVLIAALLIMPGAAARFWTERLESMLLVSAFVGFVVGLVGTSISARVDNAPAGPVLVLVGSSIFMLSMFFAPRRGLVARLVADRRSRLRLENRRFLEVLFDLMEPALPERQPIALADVLDHRGWSSRDLGRLVDRAEKHGWVDRVDREKLRATEKGLRKGARYALSHRLWLTFLDEHPDQIAAYANLSSTDPAELLPADLMESVRGKLLASGRWPSADLLETSEELSR